MGFLWRNLLGWWAHNISQTKMVAPLSKSYIHNVFLLCTNSNHGIGIKPDQSTNLCGCAALGNHLSGKICLAVLFELRFSISYELELVFLVIQLLTFLEYFFPWHYLRISYSTCHLGFCCVEIIFSTRIFNRGVLSFAWWMFFWCFSLFFTHINLHISMISRAISMPYFYLHYLHASKGVSFLP